MFSPGQALGNYRILSQIGVGGMGMVYLAEHPLIGKKVALKVIHRELSSNKEVVGRFFREAKSVNQIGNEHIVQIHDFGQTDDGYHFYIMEYLEGRTLASVMTEVGQLEAQRMLHISAQIANGLGAAHAQGIIHRDLKPDNVMLVPKLGDPDFVKVLDFGLAKLVAGGDVKKLTAQGVVLGTPQYMSPEACESKEDIDHRSDIYSLGILMFQMLCAQVPFGGDSMGEVLVKHVAHPPPAPRAFNPNVPPSVEQIILRCLAKDPNQRFADMRELRQALLDADGYLASSPPVVPSAGSAGPEAKTVFPGAAGIAPGAPGAAAAPAPAAPGPAVGSEKATVLGKIDAASPPPGSPPGAPAPGTAGAEASTQFMDGVAAAPAAGAAPGAAGSGPDARTAYMDASVMPDVPQPAAPQNATMMIGTPQGYKSRPPRKLWPIFVAVLTVLAVGGAAAALVMNPELLGRDSAKKDEDGEEELAAAELDAGAEGPDEKEEAEARADAAPVIEMATIRLTTVPPGATVFNAAGVELGTTPTTIEMKADGAEHELVFNHPKAREHRKTVVASGDTALAIELERIEARRGRGKGREGRGKGKGKGEGKGKEDPGRAGNGVLMPDF